MQMEGWLLVLCWNQSADGVRFATNASTSLAAGRATSRKKWQRIPVYKCRAEAEVTVRRAE